MNWMVENKFNSWEFYVTVHESLERLDTTDSLHIKVLSTQPIMV